MKGHEGKSQERGVALLITFVLMVMLSGLALAVGTLSTRNLVSGKSQLLDRQAFYVAEAGIQRARQAVAEGVWSYAAAPGSVYTEPFSGGEYVATLVLNPSGTITITAEAYIPNHTTPVMRRKLTASGITVTTGDGPNQSPLAVPTASTEQGNNGPGHATDGSLQTFWMAQDKGSNQWLAMAYPTDTTLDKVVVHEHNNVLESLSVQSSADGLSWTTVSNLAVTEDPNRLWTATFSDTTAQYFRVLFDSVPANELAQAEEIASYNQLVTLTGGSTTTQW